MDTMQEATGQNPIAMRQLLEAGVHFGHNTGRWNPKMKQYIFGARNGIHIIDLTHTVKLFKQAFNAVVDATSRGELVLFVGTKKQAQDVIQEEATRSGQLYVTQRWLGGTLTNFKTVKGSLERLKTLEKMEEDGTMLALTKREQIEVRRDRAKLMKSLGGIKGMNKLPGMVFVVDPAKEHIAVDEARKLEIPVVGVTDTNCDPDMMDYVIPGNDDAIRAIKLFTARIADACVIGTKVYKERAHTRGAKEEQDERVIHVSSGGDGPRVEIASGGRTYGDSEASASPTPQE
ncbi:MAG: 30S ribosomal protein S2 [Kofleriaceae bacterium]|nr:MAG: 30S ribosomal protein S2 [Kofleriaceae bacterium]MBZ0233543.1 30S ribosomal protein S2 [Kofleriaceae bacterium]